MKPTFLAALLVIATLAVPGLPPAPVAANAPFIQPGMPLNGVCTLNFVFDGPGGEVYLGTAGHCINNVGQSASTTGAGGFGSAVYDNDGALDFALIKVHSAFVSRVKAEVQGIPGTPTGSTVFTETLTGDVIRYSGWGIGFSATAQTRENRVGVLVLDDANQYKTYGTTIFGDSGGPAIHFATGKAIGIVNGIYILPYAGMDFGTTIQAILAKCAQDGFPIALRTV